MCSEFHPDGHLFGVGGKNGQITLFQVQSGGGWANVATFDAGGVPNSLSFSENGTWLASSTKGQTSVTIWDLRKMQTLKVLEIGSQIESVRWDYTGQFVATAGPGCVSVQQYSKASKSWSEPFRKAVPAKDLQWGPDASSLIVLRPDGAVGVLG